MREAQRENDFHHFASDRLVGREECVFHHLLRDGGATLYIAAGGKIGEDGAYEGEWVDAGVGVKRVVFNRYRRLLDEGVDLIERNRRAADCAVYVVEHHIAGPVVDLGLLGDLPILKIVY